MIAFQRQSEENSDSANKCKVYIKPRQLHNSPTRSSPARATGLAYGGGRGGEHPVKKRVEVGRNGSREAGAERKRKTFTFPQFSSSSLSPHLSRSSLVRALVMTASWPSRGDTSFSRRQDSARCLKSNLALEPVSQGTAFEPKPDASEEPQEPRPAGSKAEIYRKWKIGHCSGW